MTDSVVPAKVAAGVDPLDVRSSPLNVRPVIPPVAVTDATDRRPLDGLYVNGPITSSTYKTFDDVFVLLNGIKYVPLVLSDVTI